MSLQEVKPYPSLEHLGKHKHGITVRPTKQQKPRKVFIEDGDGSITMPKTYLTRKGRQIALIRQYEYILVDDFIHVCDTSPGALVLFSSPETLKRDDTYDVDKVNDIDNALEQLGNVRKLMASILFFTNLEVRCNYSAC